MKRLSLAILLTLSVAAPALAQQQEFGILVGGSRRFVEGAIAESENAFIESNFSFSNSVVELYWATEVEPELYFKIKAGRIETQVPIKTGEIDGDLVRRDAEGEVQHAEGLLEYRFSEPYGSTGLFAGLGFYRHSASGSDSTNSWGVSAGVNADFPLSPRYGIVVEGTYHWTRGDFSPRYMTVTGGLRIAY